jgi:hypothetical protein
MYFSWQRQFIVQCLDGKTNMQWQRHVGSLNFLFEYTVVLRPIPSRRLVPWLAVPFSAASVRAQFTKDAVWMVLPHDGNSVVKVICSSGGVLENWGAGRDLKKGGTDLRGRLGSLESLRPTTSPFINGVVCRRLGTPAGVLGGLAKDDINISGMSLKHVEMFLGKFGLITGAPMLADAESL